MSIISGIIFDHQWQHSQADSDQTSIKRPFPVMWPWDTTSLKKTVEEEQQLSSHWIDKPVFVCCVIL